MKKNLLILFTLFFYSHSSHAEIEFVDDLDGLTEQEKAWLLGDAPAPNATSNINGGQLSWLTLMPKTTTYHLHNKMTIDNKALHSGWLKFVQCHYNIDPISKVEVQYQALSVRKLHIDHYKNMRLAKLEPNTANRVILSGVEKGGEVCISGESKTLKPVEGLEDNLFKVRRGPYMRKFFDGFYPMQVTEELDWRATSLSFIESQPIADKGYQQKMAGKTLLTHYAFEGVLTTEYFFKVVQ